MKVINENWRPHQITSKALLRDGYSQQQLNDISNTFVERYLDKTVDGASSKFSKMVRSSGVGHNLKPRDNPAPKILKEMRKAIENKYCDISGISKRILNQQIDPTMEKRMAEMLANRD